jgi:hypothetical protein
LLKAPEIPVLQTILWQAASALQWQGATEVDVFVLFETPFATLI